MTGFEKDSMSGLPRYGFRPPMSATIYIVSFLRWADRRNPSFDLFVQLIGHERRFAVTFHDVVREAAHLFDGP